MAAIRNSSFPAPTGCRETWDRRIELLVPIADRPSREKLNRMLETYFADTRQAWRLLPDGSHERLQPDAHHPLALRSSFSARPRPAPPARASKCQRLSPSVRPKEIHRPL